MKKTIFKPLLLLAAILCAGSLHAQTVLQNVYAHKHTSLNGSWQIIVDPFDAGFYDYRLKESPTGFFQNRVAQGPRDLVEYDFVPAEQLYVPGDWNTQRPELFLYEGSIWYKKDFTYQRKPGTRLYLYFGAANYLTHVYLNGQKLGMHEGGFTPFHFDITDRVRDGENFVIVRVNDDRKPENVPTVNSDWWNYGGITRDVLLVETPETYVDDYRLDLAPGRYNQLAGYVQLNQAKAGQTVTLAIDELKVKETLTTDAQGRATFTLKAKPTLWTPEQPKLYDVRLTCGETLDENGNFTQENFQDRARHQEGGTAQMLELICKEGANHWKPSFTIMGFRYAKVETDADLTGAEFTAHAVYSDMAVTGQFTCGRDDVNQLVQNSVWSQKGNFCDIPTDCPTRERAGWTGDMGVFIETGLTLMDCYPVVEKWLAECRLNQYPDGRMANIAPPSGRPGPMTPMLCMSAGWGDAAILVPWAMYRRTGDRRILADNYGMMQRWYAFLLGRAQQTTPEQQDGAYAKYTVLNGLDYGEWCEPGITPMQAMMNPRKSVGTAYLAYSGRLLADVAQALGRAQDAETYREISQNAVKAYRAAFTKDGVICSDRQCEYVRAIEFSLLGQAESQAAADTLARMVEENGYHLNTGFLSTPFLCSVLARYGHADTAYKLLLQQDAPGWLYEVKQGATTVWETWTGIDAQGKPHDSLNHYSYGSICGWLFGGVCGIRLAGGKLSIRPTPNKALGYAKAVYDSPAGRIESGWRYEGDEVVYTFAIPCNMTAAVTLPDGRSLTLQPGTHTV